MSENPTAHHHRGIRRLALIAAIALGAASARADMTPGDLVLSGQVRTCDAEAFLKGK